MKFPPGRAAFAAVSMFVVAVVSSVYSQDLDDVTISGRVLDSNHHAIAGATVTATLIESGIERIAVTDNNGRYSLIKLPPGTYKVKAEAAGFGAKERIDLITVSGQNLQVDIDLAPAAIQARAVVTVDDKDAPAVDTTRTVVGGTIEQREIEEIPNNGRNPLDLVFTLGGVVEEPLSTRDLAEDKGSRGESAPGATPAEAGIVSLSGGPAYSNNLTIDGLDNNDDRQATFRFQPSLEAVAEVQIIKNQFSAEYGRASGGRLNLRTRAGTRRYRGRAAYFFRDDALNANTWRNNSRNIARPDFQNHNPAFTFGGPVPIGKRARKTFFFAAYEYDTICEDTVIDTYVPVQQNSLYPLPPPTNSNEQINVGVEEPVFVAPYVENVPTPLRNHIIQFRVDHNFTKSNSIYFSYQFGRRDDFRQFSGGSRLAEALIGNSRDTDAFSVSHNYVLSPKSVNQARFQYSQLRPFVISDTELSEPVMLIGLPSLLDRGTTLIAGSSTTGSSSRRETRWQFQDAFTYVTGNHSLKFGVDLQHIRSMFIDRSDATGTYNFANPGSFLSNTVSRYRHNFDTTSSQSNVYLGVFVQDEWRLRRSLTFSYGLRYERESILDDNNNFGPRLALAWDPLKTGNTVIRAGAGIFYNRVLLRTVDDFTLTTNSLVFDTNRIPNGDQRDTVLQDLSQRFPHTLSIDDARQICTQTGMSCDTGAFGRFLDPDLRIPESYQTNIGFERKLGKRFVFEANYSFNKTTHLWRDVSANAPRIPPGFNSLAEYLLSQPFNNAPVNGSRPLYNVSGARDVIRFVTSWTPPPVGDPARCTGAPTNAEQGGCMIINGVPTTIINLNSQTALNSSPPITVALAAVRHLRPDPTRTQLERLSSIGNSLYHGLTFELRRRYRRLGHGFSGSMRFAYTLSSSKDDGIVNTSSSQIAGDFASEWARSLQDRRHRAVFSGTFEVPSWLGKMRLSPLVRWGSASRFNLSGGGVDRNLDDVNNDRPNYSGDPNQIVYRNPGDPFPQSVFDALSRPMIGSIGGDLPRNAGRGPGLFLFDMNISRQFDLGERKRLRPHIEIGNILNARVFSFGTAFINATDPQLTFLVPNRTYRPRQIRLGARFDF